MFNVGDRVSYSIFGSGEGKITAVLSPDSPFQYSVLRDGEGYSTGFRESELKVIIPDHELAEEFRRNHDRNVEIIRILHDKGWSPEQNGRKFNPASMNHPVVFKREETL